MTEPARSPAEPHHPLLTRSEAVWLILGVATAAMVLGAAFSWRTLAAQYWAHRLSGGDRAAIERLEKLGPAATGALLSVMAGTDPAVPKSPTDVSPGGAIFRGPGGKVRVVLPPIDPHHQATVLLSKLGSRGEEALFRAIADAGDSLPRRARLCFALRMFDSDRARRAYARAVVDEELGVYRFFSPEFGSSVDAALRALTWRQEDDGRWSAARWGARGASDLEVTSLAVLAFLANGHTDAAGTAGHGQVASGLSFVLAQQAEGGRFGTGSIAGHALAALALSENLAMRGGKDQQRLDALRQAVKHTLGCQDASGGWTQRPGDPPEVFASALCVAHLRSAALAGVEVPAGTWSRSLAFLDALTLKDGPDRGLVRPRPGEPPTLRAAAAGAAARHWLGPEGGDPGRHPLRQHLMDRNAECLRDPWAAWLACCTLWHADRTDKRWKPWSDEQRDVLVRNQAVSGVSYGAWPPATEEARAAGLVATTALGVLTLTARYEYLPLYRLEVNPAKR